MLFQLNRVSEKQETEPCDEHRANYSFTLYNSQPHIKTGFSAMPAIGSYKSTPKTYCSWKGKKKKNETAILELDQYHFMWNRGQWRMWERERAGERWVFQTEAKIQNITWEDMAIRNQVTKAKATESWNRLQGRCIWALQKFKSLAYKTAIPADEHAAARDKVAVTCI